MVPEGTVRDDRNVESNYKVSNLPVVAAARLRLFVRDRCRTDIYAGGKLEFMQERDRDDRDEVIVP